MPSWISSILFAAATTLFIGLFVNPRLEARKPRIEAKNNQKRLAWEARAEFNKRILTILSACGRLKEPVPASLAESRPALAERLNGERQRWLDQLDGATRYLVDNMELFALGYPTDRLRRIISDFVFHARGIVLSDRTVEKQVQRLTALTAPVQDLFFVPRWRAPTVVRSVEQFERALAALTEDLPPDDRGTAPVPGPTPPQAAA